MGFGTGLELANGALAFAEHQNVELMGARGNQVIDGVGVTPQGTPDLTVAVASGNVLAGGIVVAVGANATFAGTPNTFATTQGNLTSGQAEFVFIHIDSSGVITNTEGGAAAAGQQLPPDVPEDEVVIAMITLTEGDTTIDSVDIEDWRINVPKGGYFAGTVKLSGVNSHLKIEETDANADEKQWIIDAEAGQLRILTENDAGGSFTTVLSINRIGNTTDGIKNPIDDAGFFTGVSDDFRMYHSTNGIILNITGSLILDQNLAAGDIELQLGGNILFKDSDDSDVVLFDLDTSARSLTVGAVADPITTTHNGEMSITLSQNSTTSFDIINATSDTAARAGLFIGQDTGSNAGGFLVTSPAFSANPDEFQMFTGSGIANGIRITSAAGPIILAPFTDVLQSTGSMKNQVDNEGFYTGASDDLRIYHDGSSDNIILNGSGTNLLIGNNTSQNVTVVGRFTGHIITEAFSIKDSDDGSENLFVFDTTARTLVIGATDGNDDVNTSIFGTLTVADALNVTSGIGLDTAVLTFGSGATGNAIFTGDIIPNISASKDLGGSGSRWRDIHVSREIFVYGLSADTGTNLVKDATDRISLDSSSKRFKKDFEDLTVDSSIIYDLTPKEFKYKNSDSWSFSYIAEDVEKLDRRLVHYNREGFVQTYDTKRLQVLAIEEIKNLNRRINKLEEHIYN